MSSRQGPRAPTLPSRRRLVSLATAVVAALLAAGYEYFNRSAGPPGRVATSATVGAPPGFDFYLLALTVEPAFCEDGNQRIGQCRRLTRAAFEQTPLVLHGLWPERRRRGDYPRDCPGPRLQLDRETTAQLQRWMPGASEGLDRHEWRTHGTCSGLDDDRYFQLAIANVQRANEALGAALRAAAGRRVEAAELRAAADRAVPSFGRSVVFMCKNLRSDAPQKRGRAYLYEIRVCLDNDGTGGAPGALLACDAVGRRDEGCGREFWMDDV